MQNSDVVSGHEITIRPKEGGRILSVRRLAVGHEASGLTVRPLRDGSRVTVEFHHLNPGDWIAIRLLHSGGGQPSVTGEFVGYSLRQYTPSSWTSTVVLIGSAWVCVTMTAFRSAASLVLAEAGLNPPVVSLVAPVTSMVISVIGIVSFVVWLLACFYRFLFRR